MKVKLCYNKICKNKFRSRNIGWNEQKRKTPLSRGLKLSFIRGQHEEKICLCGTQKKAKSAFILQKTVVSAIICVLLMMSRAARLRPLPLSVTYYWNGRNVLLIWDKIRRNNWMLISFMKPTNSSFVCRINNDSF